MIKGLLFVFLVKFEILYAEKINILADNSEFSHHDHPKDQ